MSKIPPPSSAPSLQIHIEVIVTCTLCLLVNRLPCKDFILPAKLGSRIPSIPSQRCVFFPYSRQKDLSFPLRWDDSTHFHPDRQTWSGGIEISQRIHFTLQDLYWFIKLRILLKLKYFACARGPSTTSARLISGEKTQNFFKKKLLGNSKFLTKPGEPGSPAAPTLSLLWSSGEPALLGFGNGVDSAEEMVKLNFFHAACIDVSRFTSSPVPSGCLGAKPGNETSQWPINDLKFCSN